MNKFKTVIGMIGALSCMMMIGCVEKFEANVDDIPVEGLVVEGDIISDSTVVFQLSKTMPLANGKGYEDFLAGYLNVVAEVMVKGNDGTCWLGEGEGKGRYRVEIGTLQPEVEYSLEIHYDGDTYQSVPQKPLPCVGIEKLDFMQPELESPVSVLLETEEGNGPQYFLWYFEEDWELRSHFHTNALYDPDLKQVINYAYPPVAQGWCKSKTDQFLLGTTESSVLDKIVGKTIQTINYTDRRLSVLYSIRVYQRNLTVDEYEYYSVRSKQNNEMGGLFTPQPSELPTNITCSNSKRKVIGYVGCNMAVAQRQLYIEEEDVFYLDTNMCEFGKEPGPTYADNYAAGFQICEKSQEGIEWARKECVDIRLWNADPMGRPSWWPNRYLYLPDNGDM